MVESMLGSPRHCLLFALSSDPASSVQLVPNGPSPRTQDSNGGRHRCGCSPAWWQSASSRGCVSLAVHRNWSIPIVPARPRRAPSLLCDIGMKPSNAPATRIALHLRDQTSLDGPSHVSI